ncbi:MAG: thiolase domain-containing protein, partial [Anaerolineales bacterium]|nr:thiolase domain-containing protein [Anaerolineales bacterium]
HGWKMAADGRISLTGNLPCATMGGLKARGFAGGATGVYQAVEAATQLRGQAEACQVTRARVGMIQSLGGPASTAVVHILEKLD